MSNPPCRYGDSSRMTLLANALAVALAQGLTKEEKNVLGNLLTLVSDSILSMAAIEEACGKN